MLHSPALDDCGRGHCSPFPPSRPSPKLVLIALQLCRIALPLMTVAECSQVTVPSHPSLSRIANTKASGRSLAADIVGLLLAKLAEYIVPDASQVGSNWDLLALRLTLPVFIGVTEEPG